MGMPEWIGDYRREWLRLDVVAGLTAAAVVIPEGDGLRHHRRPAGAGRALHRVRADA